MSIKDVAQAIRHGRNVMDGYGDLIVHHETCTRYTIIDPIIWALGWKTWDPAECQLEYQRGQQGKADYAFFSRDDKLVIIIEAKRLDKNSADFERQLAKYALGMKKGIGVLTDGQLWHLYDCGMRGKFESKCIATVDIYSDGIQQAARKLNGLLSKAEWW